MQPSQKRLDVSGRISDSAAPLGRVDIRLKTTIAAPSSPISPRHSRFLPHHSRFLPPSFPRKRESGRLSAALTCPRARYANAPHPNQILRSFNPDFRRPRSSCDACQAAPASALPASCPRARFRSLSAPSVYIAAPSACLESVGSFLWLRRSRLQPIACGRGRQRARLGKCQTEFRRTAAFNTHISTALAIDAARPPIQASSHARETGIDTRLGIMQV